MKIWCTGKHLQEYIWSVWVNVHIHLFVTRCYEIGCWPVFCKNSQTFLLKLPPLKWWPALHLRTSRGATCRTTRRDPLTTWKLSNMAATANIWLKEASRLFARNMGIGLKSHPAKVELTVHFITNTQTHTYMYIYISCDCVFPGPCRVGIHRGRILYKGQRLWIKDLTPNRILHSELVSVYCLNKERNCGYAVPTQCIDGKLKIPECFEGKASRPMNAYNLFKSKKLYKTKL